MLEVLCKCVQRVLSNYCAGEATVLEINTHLRPVKRAIWEARAQWRDIGRALELTEGAIKSIHEPNDGECLHEVLFQWIQPGAATMPYLLQALEDVTVNRKDIANEICALRGKARTSVGL